MFNRPEGGKWGQHGSWRKNQPNGQTPWSQYKDLYQGLQNGQSPYGNLFQSGIPFQQIMQGGPMAGLFGQNGMFGQGGQLAQMFSPQGVIGKRLANTQFGQQMQNMPPWVQDIPFLGSLFGQPQQPTTQTPLPPDQGA